MSFLPSIFLGVLLCSLALFGREVYAISSYYDNYQVSYGGNNVLPLDNGKEVHIVLDQSGSSGIISKLHYCSGYFRMRMKLPGGDSAGVVTTFYLIADSGVHDELDFEFLGNRPGKPYAVQTNIFVNGNGNREQRIRLWFDPTKDFHDYKILWNSHQIVFYVDNFPIRVLRNRRRRGVEYPSQSMKVLSTIWNGDDWATDGGREKINWSAAPFTVALQGFEIDGHASEYRSRACYSPRSWWNSRRYWRLNAAEASRYRFVRKYFLTYDYCTDKTKHATPPAECRFR